MEHYPQNPGRPPQQPPQSPYGYGDYPRGGPQSAPPPPRRSSSPVLSRLMIAVIVLVICVGGLVGGYTIITSGGGGSRPVADPSEPRPSESASPDEGGGTAGGEGNVQRTPRLGMEIYQGDEAAPLTHDVSADDARTTEAALAAEPFELRIPLLKKDVALQICVWTDDSVFSLSNGMKLTETTCFSPGTGAADTEFGSGTLFLGKDRHNYLIDKRVKKLSDSTDAVYYSSVFQEGGSVPLKEWERPLYLTVLVDEDGDGEVGNSEYEYVALDFDSSG